MELMFGYIAGLLTLINPCVLPVLPLILASAIRREPLGPVALCLGLSLSFVLLGVSVAALGPLIGLNSDDVARAGAITMIGFGLIIMVPELSARFASATSNLSNYADKLAGGTMSGGIGGHLIKWSLTRCSLVTMHRTDARWCNISSRTGRINSLGRRNYDEFRTGHIDNYFAFGLRCPRYDKQAAG